MRFKRITFKNYRCFVDGSVAFDESTSRNINLLVGPNGGGKTELLFAFWWVLYGFDFRSLQNKEATPYALNCDAYRILEDGADGLSKSCDVTLEIENNGTIYELLKTARYTKKGKKISLEEKRRLSYYKSNGEKSLPITNEAVIEKNLSKIIPKAVLNGILFDGERMKKLSSAEDDSKKAIQGTIYDITNVALLEACKSTYRGIKQNLTKTTKTLKGTSSTAQISEINDLIETIEEELESFYKKKETWAEEYSNNEVELQNISIQLLEIREAREKQEEKKSKESELKNRKKLLDKYYDDFRSTLTKGHLFLVNDLLDSVEKIIEKYKVPEGLTVEAVKSIISQGTCICGHPLHEEELSILNKLIEILPPDNLNTTLLEASRKLREDAENVKAEAVKDYKSIIECEKEIQTIKEDIIHLSTQILEGDEARARDLEKRNQELQRRQGKLELAMPSNERKIKAHEKNLKTKRAERDETSKNDGKLQLLNTEIKYVEKCQRALDVIGEINKNKALTEINKRIEEAYAVLSEDSKRGRRIHIVQYNDGLKYRMVVYMDRESEDLIAKWKDSGTYNELLKNNYSEDQIKELSILRCIDASSTGQGKMNTLAFAKAILDYSNQEKGGNTFETRKDYPLLIDAPFSDISGDNLSNSARELHNFSGQIILMIDPDKYENVKEWIEPFVSTEHYFQKTENQNVSKIIAG